MVDLGAGSGNLSRAPAANGQGSSLLVDNRPELLAEAAVPAGRRRPGISTPGYHPKRGAALLLSSFACIGYKHPSSNYGTGASNCGPVAGWLAVPLEGSFASWHQAAARAGVACSALPLPREGDLLAALPGCWPQQRLSFSCRYPSAMAFLAELNAMASMVAPAPNSAPANCAGCSSTGPCRSRIKG